MLKFEKNERKSFYLSKNYLVKVAYASLCEDKSLNIQNDSTNASQLCINQCDNLRCGLWFMLFLLYTFHHTTNAHSSNKYGSIDQ